MYALLILLAAALSGSPQATDSASIADYLMEPGREIALARSAGPAHVGADATIHVLGRHGYAVAQEGNNGFHCLVLRSWAGPRRSLDTRVIAPICYNPQAARTILPVKVFLSRRLAEGVSLESLNRELEAAVHDGTFALPEAGSFAYMLSGHQWLNERSTNWRPHLMFYAAHVTDAEVGGNGVVEGMPFVAGGETGTFGNITIPLPESNFVWAEEANGRP